MAPQLFAYLGCCRKLEIDYGVQLREKDVKLSEGVGNWTPVYRVGVRGSPTIELWCEVIWIFDKDFFACIPEETSFSECLPERL